MLDDARPRRLTVRIVDCCVALEIRLIKQLRLKPHRAVLERPVLILEILVDRAGIDHLLRLCQIIVTALEEVCLKLHFRAFKHVFDKLCIAGSRNPLIKRIKIIVVKSQAHRQPSDNECRQILAVTPPLLLGVALDKLFKNVFTDQKHRLLLEVARL